MQTVEPHIQNESAPPNLAHEFGKTPCVSWDISPSVTSRRKKSGWNESKTFSMLLILKVQEWQL